MLSGKISQFRLSNENSMPYTGWYAKWLEHWPWAEWSRACTQWWSGSPVPVGGHTRGNQSIDVSLSNQCLSLFPPPHSLSLFPTPSLSLSLKINWKKYPWGRIKKVRKNSMPLLNLTTVEATLHSHPVVHYIQIHIAIQPQSLY